MAGKSHGPPKRIRAAIKRGVKKAKAALKKAARKKTIRTGPKKR